MQPNPEEYYTKNQIVKNEWLSKWKLEKAINRGDLLFKLEMNGRKKIYLILGQDLIDVIMSTYD